MRAVNLIPVESARGGQGRSGTGAFLVLGILSVLVAGAVAYVLTNNAVVERRAEVEQLNTQIQAIRVQTEATRPYREFKQLADARLTTVRQLGQARFDWHRALSDFAKVVPEDVWLTSMLGTVTTGVNVEGAASGATSTLRSALPNPAIELTGCTTSHKAVARMISKMRLLTNVYRVSLADSAKEDATAGGGGDCRYGRSDIAQFDMVVFFDSIPALPVATDVTTSPAASTTPASTGTSSNANGSDIR
jgi:Tfp pilus assembly protein PilN